MSALTKIFTSLVYLLLASAASAQNYNNPDPPTVSGTAVSNAQRRLTFTPYPSAERFRMFRADTLTNSWLEDTGGSFSGLAWSVTNSFSNAFYRLQVTPVSSNALLNATVLSKLTYGPTPELLDRLAIIGPEPFIREQLNPETITENAGLAHTNINFLAAKFGTGTNVIPSAATATGPGSALIQDFRAWFVLNAVNADRQLLEILTQFCENHFVTQYGKSASFFAGLQYGNSITRLATDWEWREVSRWRQVLLNTNGTFLDLLKISAESPAMLTYLDTATSKGSGNFVPNENYSRELLELFTMGVDNGYDQGDITSMAPCWTGWTLQLVATNNALNPFAPKSTTQITAGGGGAFTNLLGVWVLNFNSFNHATYAKTLFGGKMVTNRFGAYYTSKIYGGNATPGLYQLTIPSRTSTNGIQDGYDVMAHLVTLPYTQEFISVKLCRLFVHDDFYTGYNFNDPNLSEEGKLVKACMDAWETSNPKGQIRAVLATIFNSSLFRSPGGYAHKVKTPLEFCVSAIRALRVSTNGTGLHGTFTASSDGYGLVFSAGNVQQQGKDSPLNRMGSMDLFNRAEPDGYPEAGSGWVNAGSLAERIRYVQSLLLASGQTGKNDDNIYLNNNLTDPVTLLRSRLPLLADQKDAGKVADLFLGLLYPGEGKASLDEYRTIAMNYLNTTDDGLSASLFSSLTPSNTSGNIYDTRVRGMVGLLMCLQRFHEQ